MKCLCIELLNSSSIKYEPFPHITIPLGIYVGNSLLEEYLSSLLALPLAHTDRVVPELGLPASAATAGTTTRGM